MSANRYLQEMDRLEMNRDEPVQFLIEKDGLKPLKGTWVARFWRWSDFESFVKAFAAIVLFFGLLTYLFYDNPKSLGAFMGVMSAGIECMLGVP